MRTSLWMALALLALVLVGGWLTGREMRQISERYVSAAEELSVLTEGEDWPRAAEIARAYLADWRERLPMLQTLINHEDTDDVTLALVQLQAAIEARDKAGCLTACALLKENARHLYHRDAFALENVL